MAVGRSVSKPCLRGPVLGSSPGPQTEVRGGPAGSHSRRRGHPADGLCCLPSSPQAMELPPPPLLPLATKLSRRAWEFQVPRDNVAERGKGGGPGSSISCGYVEIGQRRSMTEVFRAAAFGDAHEGGQTFQEPIHRPLIDAEAPLERIFRRMARLAGRAPPSQHPPEAIVKGGGRDMRRRSH